MARILTLPLLFMGKDKGPSEPGLGRREFLRLVGIGLASTVLPRFAVSQGRITPPNPELVEHIRITASPLQAQLFAGAPTDLWGYAGTVLAGRANMLKPFPGTSFGPAIYVQRNQWLKVDVVNNLPEETVIHWHGIHLPESEDGHPRYAVPAGGSYQNFFKVHNRAGTYWFHPHPDMKTATQVFKGCAGVLIVSDPEEQALDLPRGVCDVPIVIQDRRFNVGNQLVYNQGGMSGFLGNKILINGQANYVHTCGTRCYRFRILNGSNSRIYKLAWEDNSPMTLIGTDGGLIAAPIDKPYITLAPGERVEIWKDMRDYAPGTLLKLKSLYFTGAGANAGQSPGQGATMDIMSLYVDYVAPESLVLPKVLSNPGFHSIEEAINMETPRHFPVSISDGKWVLNGAPYSLYEVAANEMVRLNTVELWEFSNILGMTPTAHPIHIHGPQFQVIKRTIEPDRATAWEGVRHGYTDEGWKDTFLLMPGETAFVLIKFSRYPGTFLYHCHNLEHEDMGMMRNFQIDP